MLMLIELLVLAILAIATLFTAGSDNSQANNKAHAIAWVWLEGASEFFAYALESTLFILSDGDWQVSALEMDKKIKWVVGELSSTIYEVLSTCPLVEWAKGLLDLYQDQDAHPEQEKEEQNPPSTATDLGSVEVNKPKPPLDMRLLCLNRKTPLDMRLLCLEVKAYERIISALLPSRKQVAEGLQVLGEEFKFPRLESLHRLAIADSDRVGRWLDSFYLGVEDRREDLLSEGIDLNPFLGVD